MGVLIYVWDNSLPYIEIKTKTNYDEFNFLEFSNLLIQLNVGSEGRER